MGFEQLAALRDQLAKEAERKPGGKRARLQPSTGPARMGKRAIADRLAPAPTAEPAHRVHSASGAKFSPAARSASGAKRGAPVKAATAGPVNPVILTIGKLQRRFPKTFPRNPAPKVPLKVGIFKDLMAYAQELALSEAELREAMKAWCRGNRYWACLVEGAPRIDLAGEAAGCVLPADAARASSLKAHRATRTNAKAAAAAEPASAAEPTNEGIEQTPAPLLQSESGET